MAEIREIVLHRGSSMDVTVVVADSPSQFFCQPLESANDLATVMNGISHHCRSSGRVLSHPTVGQFCCALFTEDDNWYRARVLSTVSSSGGVRVLYVDYGNVEDLPISRLRELPESFSRLPMQALCCRLADVAPAKGQFWSSKACDDFKVVIEDELCMEVAGPPDTDGTIPVRLTSYTTEMDMAAELLKQGLAVEKPEGAGVNVGDHLRVTVVVVETPESFWFQRTEHLELDNMMQELGKRYESMHANEHVVAKSSVGDLCCAQYSEDHCWYRAVVSASSGSLVTVRFLDYGNVEEVVQVKTLLPEFSCTRLPPQAYRARLTNYGENISWADDICYAFEEWVMMQEDLHFNVTNVCDDFVTVEFVDDGQAATAAKILKRPRLSQQPLSLPQVQIENNRWYDVMVCHVDNPNSLFCQLCTNFLDLKEVMDSIANFSGTQLGQVQREQLCVAPSFADGRLYRAQVMNVISVTVCQVQFVDFGNVEEVEISKLRSIEPGLCHLPRQAIPCSLSIPQHIAQDKTNQLRSITHGKQLVGQFSMLDGVRVVRLIDTTGSTDVDVLQQLKSEQRSPAVTGAFKYPQLRSGSTHQMFLTVCNSPSDLWLSLSERSDALNILMLKLTEHEGKLKQLPGPAAVVGAMCCARFSEDGGLYRAQITSPVAHDTVEVCFVDYGNKERRGPRDIFELSPELVEEPVFAVHCSLSGVACPKEGWTNVTCKKLDSLLIDQDLTVLVCGGVCGANSLLEIAISVSGANILEQLSLSQEGPAATTQSNSQVAGVTLPRGSVISGSKHKVQVADVQSPHCFYVQLCADQAALDALMNLLAEYKPHSETVEWKAGMYCCAAFSEDGAFYRAKVQSVSGNVAHIIFVDYGNSEDHSIADLLPLSKALTELPECALNCTLQGVVPVAGQEWSDAAYKLFSSLTADAELTAEFITSRDDKWMTQLYLPSGHSVSQALVSQGVARPAAYQHTAPANKLTFTQARLAGTAAVHVSYAESPQCFFCQPSEQSRNLDSLMENLYTYCASAPALSESQIQEGVPCCALYSGDECWYRAVILGKSNGNTVTVRFVDYGNIDTVQLSNLCPLTEQFVHMPMLAVECHLVQPQPAGNTWPEEASKRFVEQVFEQDINVKVVEHSGQSTAVCFVGDSKKIADSLMAAGGSSVSSPAHSLAKLVWKSGTRVPVYVAHCISPSEFWCQPVEQSALLEDLGAQLDSYYGGPGQSKSCLSPAVNQLCAAKFSEDGRWYRALITACNGSTAVVRFVDYGNGETQPVASLRMLESKFVAFCPALAVACNLANVSPPAGKWSDDVCASFEERVSVDELQATVVSGDSATECMVVLQDASGNVADSLPSSSQSSGQPVQAALTVKIAPSEVHGGGSVFITAAVSPDEFYCQLSSTYSELNQLMEDMAAFYSQSGSTCLTLAAGQFCAAQYSEDDAWYRAILENSVDGLLVRFVDYGNAEGAKAGRVRPLEQQFATALPAQAVLCALDSVLAPDGGWGEVCDQFCNFVMDTEFTMSVRKKDKGGRHYVQLTSGNIDIVEKFFPAAGRETFTAGSPASEAYKPETVKLGAQSCYAATITYCESPSLFYCKLEQYTDQLEALMNELQEIPTEPLGNIQEGMLCAAPFSDDGMWYRSEVTNVLGQEVTVRFVDYGNSEVVSSNDVCKLPESFASRLALQAVACSLADVLPSSGDDWSIDAFNLLEGFSEGTVTLTVSCVTAEAVYHVHVSDISDKDLARQLLSNGLARKVVSGSSDVTSASTASSVKGSGDGSIAIQVLETGAELTMIVAHIVTPSEFWCQRIESASELDGIMGELAENLPNKALSSAEAIESAVCAAQYTADDAWYRARIVTALGADVICVHFVDYGNYEELPLSRLRELPQHLRSVPAQAIHCCLAGLPALAEEEWDEASCSIMAAYMDSEVQTVVVSCDQQVSPPRYELQVNSSGGNLTGLIVSARQSVGSHESSPQPQSVSSAFPVGDTPVPGSTISLIVSSVETPSVIWCQWAPSADQLANLMASITAHFESASREPLPDGVKICAALYSVDGGWYRGEVLSSVAGKAEVLFVDYGNRETVELSNVGKLPQEFVNCLPCQAVACHLSGVAVPAGGWSSDLCQQVEDELLEQECKMMVQSVTTNGSLVGVLKTANGHDVAKLVNDWSSASPAASASAASVPVTPGSADTESTEQTQQVEDHKLPQISTVLSGLHVGGSFNAFLSFVESSGRLWFQPCELADDLGILQEQLAVHYDSEEQSANYLSEGDAQEGLLCAARFSEDMAWYRARVMSVAVKGVVTVHFVDYGNVEDVQVNDLRELGSSFFSLPEQALAVTVPAVLQAAERNLLQPLHDLVNEEAQVMVTAIGKNSVQAVVTMSTSSERVEELLRLPMVEAKTVQEPAAADYKNLLWSVGSTIEVFISHIVSPSCIFCQPADQAKQLVELMENLADLAPQAGVPSNVEQLMVCAAIFSEDGGWYRALVLSPSDDGKFADVCFVDYGNHEVVPLENLRHLPEEFLSLPAQGIKCTLGHVQPRDADGLWEPGVCKGLKEKVPADQAATVTVLEEQKSSDVAIPVRLILKDGTDVVQVVESLGGALVGSASHSSTPSTSPDLCSQLEFSCLKSGEQGFVVIADSPFKFWCQLTSHASELEQLAAELNDYCMSGSAVGFEQGHPVVGEACAALFTDDGMWYRAVVTGVADDGLEVLLVDYGNEVLKPGHILPLPSNFSRLPAQAVRCSLYGIVPHSSDAWTADALDFFALGVLEKDVVLTIHKRQEEEYGSRHIASLVTEVDGQTVDIGCALVDGGFADPSRQVDIAVEQPISMTSEAMDTANQARENVAAPEDVPSAVSEFNQQLPTIGQTMSVILAYASSPDELWFQPAADSDQLVDFGQGLADFYGMLTENEHALPSSQHIVGMPCVAQYSDDGSWYRARILAIDGGEATVRFVDYGNIAKTLATQLKSLHTDFADLPVQAFWFSLAGIGPADSSGEWPEQATERIQQLVGSEVVRASVLLAHSYDDGNSSFEVWLNDENDQDIGRQLAVEGLAVQTGELPLVEEPDVIVVSSLAEKEDNADDSKPSEDALMEQSAGGQESGSDCATSSQLNNGVVVNVTTLATSDGSQPSSEAGSRTSPAPVKIKRSSLTSTGSEVVSDFEGASSEKAWSTTATIGTETSDSELVKMIEETAAAREAMVVGGEVLVSVSHCDSPTEFWCQLPGNQPALEQMMDTLNMQERKPLEDVTVGILCCSCFGDDDKMYRTTVEDVASDDLVVVRFTDFGNSQKCTRSDLFALPSSCADLPPQAIHCALADVNPSDLTDDDVERFCRLVMSCELMALVTQVDERAPVQVRLQHNGENILSLLFGESAGKNSTQEMAENLMVEEAGGKTDSKEDEQVSAVEEVNTSSLEASSSSEASAIELLKNSEHEVTVCLAESPEEFWCQLTSSADDLNDVMQKLDEFCSSATPYASLPKMDELCAAQFSGDDVWYRARVVEIHSSGCNVFFIDYGNSEVVELARLCPLPPSCAELPAQAFKCTIAGSKGHVWSDAEIEEFGSLVQEKCLCLRVLAAAVKSGSTNVVHLEDRNQEPAVDIAEKLLTSAV